MIKSNKRTLTIAETLSSALYGQIIPSLYEITNDELHPGIQCSSFEVKSKVLRRSSPVAEETIEIHCPSYPPDGLTTRWLSDVLLNRGVAAAIPGTELQPGKILAFDQRTVCGHDRYWVMSIMTSSGVFNETKTSNAPSPNRTTFEAITLQSSVPRFLPEGDAFGVERSDMDAFIDAGIKVEVRSKPYASKSECFSMVGKDKQNAACVKELEMLMEMATRGVAPGVIAAFCVRADGANHLRDGDPWNLSNTPNAKVEVKSATADLADVTASVVVSQLSTFTLDDLMRDTRSSLVPARKDQLLNTLLSVCGPVFKQIKEMCKVHKGYGAVKLNMTPHSVVFCPSLVAVGGSWELEGAGYMPLSESHLDGVPRISDFNAALSMRVEEASYSFETSYSMHCMLMLAFSRAMHGPCVANVLWKHLLEEGDPSGFVAASRAMQSKSTNASAFLECMDANTDMHYPAELLKALADAVSDMDRAVRSGVVTKDGGLSVAEDVEMFTKIVSVVTGSTVVDTHIFRMEETDVDDGVEAEHLNALQSVKVMRLARIAGS